MGDIIGKIYMLLGLKKDKFDQGMKSAETQSNKLSASFKKLGGIIAGAFSVGVIVNFGKKLLDLYDTQVKAQAKLMVSLKGNAVAYKQIVNLASELQKKTLYGDEKTIEAAARMAPLLRDYKGAIQELLPLVQDFATNKEMDLASAAELVAKSVGSSTNALSRYGINIEGAVGSTERLQSAINALSEQFKGSAEAAAAAGTGGLTQLKNALGDIEEKLGAIIAMSADLTDLTKTLEDLNYLIGIPEQKEGVKAEKIRLTPWGNLLKWIKTDIQELAQIKRIKEERDKEVDKIIKSITRRDITFKAGTIGMIKLPTVDTSQLKDLERYTALIQRNMEVMKEAQAVMSGVSGNEAPGLADMSGIIERNKALSEKQRQMLEDERKGVIDLKAAYSELAMVGVDAFSMTIQALAAGSEDMGAVLGDALSMVASFGVEFGKELIWAGIGKSGFEAILTLPGPALIGIGSILVASFSALKGTLNRGPFSSGGGGGAYIPNYTAAPGASSSSCASMENQRIEMYAILRGDQIELTTKKSAYRNKRIG